MGKKQELLFSKVKEACQELVMSSPVRPEQKVIQAVPAAAQHGSEQMPDFRLIFDNVSPMWNQRAPQIQVLHAGTRP